MTPPACNRSRAWASPPTIGETSGGRAYERNTRCLAGREPQLGRVMEDVREPRIKQELSCGQALDEAHGGATARARP
jgi:hypothetical protein